MGRTYGRADEGKWKQVSRWVKESCKWDRWESLRWSGGWMENGKAGAWGRKKWVKTEDRKAGLRRTNSVSLDSYCLFPFSYFCSLIFLSPVSFSFFIPSRVFSLLMYFFNVYSIRHSVRLSLLLFCSTALVSFPSSPHVFQFIVSAVVEPSNLSGSSNLINPLRILMSEMSEHPGKTRLTFKMVFTW